MVGVEESLDLPSICVFTALGYFLDDTTYFKELKALQPGTTTVTDTTGRIITSEPYFKWHYEPREISFKQALDEFTELFETIINEAPGDLLTIPISGGLDSRTIVAAALGSGKEVQGYSYAFDGGHDETAYGDRMSAQEGFRFHRLTVREGTLWNYVDALAERNKCYSEFTHPRQFGFRRELTEMGGTFLLGHGGDLFFDDMGVPEHMEEKLIFETVWKRLVKPSGLELGERLWNAWGLSGTFREYLQDVLAKSLSEIRIKEANPRLRAFKSRYYVPRWTCTNLELFSDFGPNIIPYFDDRMCRFICSIPERWLSGRRIQIEYLKRRAPGLAKIPWQSHYPFNLYNHRWNKAPYNLPYRLYAKARRTLSKRQYVQRNWELQFLGPKNKSNLERRLLSDPYLGDWIPRELTEEFLNLFHEKNSLRYYHSTTMLLTLEAFCRLRSRRQVDPGSSTLIHEDALQLNNIND